MTYNEWVVANYYSALYAQWRQSGKIPTLPPSESN